MPKEDDFLTDKSKRYMERIDSIQAEFENTIKHFPEAYAETKVGKDSTAQTMVEDKISSYMTELKTVFLQVSADVKNTNKAMHNDVTNIKESKDKYRGYLEESNILEDKNYAGSTQIHDYTIRYRYEIARIIYLLGGIGIMGYIINEMK